MSVSWPGQISHDLWSFAGVPDIAVRARQAAVLAALLESGTRTPMVSLDDLRVLVEETGWWDSPSNEDLRSVLEHLHRAKHVVPFRDWEQTSSSYNDARRRKESWTLTHRGREVVEAVRTTTENLERPLQVPPGLLKSLGDEIDHVVRLATTAIGASAQGGRESAEQVERRLITIDGLAGQLRRATQDFYEALASLDQEDVTQNEIFQASRRRIVTVLQEFVQQTDSSLDATRQAALRLATIGHTEVAARAVQAAGLLEATAVPGWVAGRAAKLDQLDRWLAPGGLVDAMVANALSAIETLIGAIERRFHAHDRGSDLASDFHQLAAMIHTQADEESAQQLFAAAFGLWPARHPRRPRIEEVSEIVHGTSGFAPVEASAVLRQVEVGSRGRRTRKRIPDTSAARAARRAEEAEELERLRTMYQELATTEPVGLGHFDGLSREHGAALIELIELAMDSFDAAEGFGQAVNPLCELRLWPLAPQRVVTVHFDEGALFTYDKLVHIACTPAGMREAATGVAA